MRVVRRDAGGGDWLIAANAVGDGVVEVEELGQEVGLGGEAVGGEDRRVERGVGLLEGIRAGQLQRAIDRAQAAGDLTRRVDAADLAARGRVNGAWSTLDSMGATKRRPIPCGRESSQRRNQGIHFAGASLRDLLRWPLLRGMSHLQT